MIKILTLIFLIVLFFLIFYHRKTEYFYNSNKTLIPNFNKNKHTIIVGTSQYIMNHIEDLKRLKKTGKYQFIAHQGAWGFFEKKLGFYPDYLSIFDIEVPKNIRNYDDIFKKKELVKLIYYSFWDTDYEKLCISTSVLRKGRKFWENYKNTKLKIRNRIIIPAELITNYKTRKESQYKLNKNCGNYNNNEKKLFILNCGKYIKDKLSLHILPLIIYLKIKNVYIMGFDNKGNNWNDTKRSPKDFNKVYLKYHLPNLIDKIKKNNINIYNLIESKNTELHPYIQFKNIKELN